MNLQTIAEHTVDMDLLPNYAKILDLGCRGFEFTYFMRRKSHNVCAVDIDDLGCDDYFRIAVSDKIGRVGIKRSNDPQATSICDGGEIMCVTLGMLSIMTMTKFWDLIKMDIEGSEYEVIMSMDKPYATQISCEFHIHCGQTEKQVQECVDKLHSLGYKTIQHEKTARHGLPKNYWDSLFCL